MPLPAYAEPHFERTNIFDGEEGMLDRQCMEANIDNNDMMNSEGTEAEQSSYTANRAADASPVLRFAPMPAPFCDIEITMADVQDNINSDQSFQHVVNMICEGNIYLITDPVVAGDELKCRVKSETDKNLSYLVSIKRKGMLSRKFKEKFKNYIYKCECPVKKVGSIIFYF